MFTQTTDNRPPGPRHRLPGQTFLRLRRSPIDFLSELARDHGDIVYFQIAGRHAYLLNHPDLVKELLVNKHRQMQKGRALRQAEQVLGQGLLTSEGSYHLQQRRLIQPAFHRRRLTRYAGSMVGHAARRAEGWQAGQVVDMHEEMMDLTLAIVGQTLFGIDITAEARQNVAQALQTIISLFPRTISPLAPLLSQLPLPATRRFEQALAELDAVVAELIRIRRREGDQGDLLSMLLLAQEAGSDAPGMTSDQLRDEILTILLAGHETTANALSWTWYLLAQHPRVAAKLQAELTDVLAGRLPTLDDLPRLQYTRMVLSESMRLYPPAWAIGRQTVTECRFGGYQIPVGSTLLVSQWVMHRDRRFYPDPLRFDPGRWTAEAIAQRPKYAYFPFGAGARLCIGEQFAWMEGTLVLAVLAQRWQPVLLPGQSVEPQPSITLRPRNGLQMVLHQPG